MHLCTAHVPGALQVALLPALSGSPFPAKYAEISFGENATSWSKLDSKITKLIAKGKALGAYRKGLGGPHQSVVD